MSLISSAERGRLGELTRESRFAEAIALLKSGACDELSPEDWADQDPARSRPPIALICDRQYEGAKKTPNPLENALIQALIDAWCPVDAIDDYGNCALNYAAGSGDVAKVSILLSAGADLDGRGAEWAPLLSPLSSRKEGASAAVWRLLEGGARLDDFATGPGGEPRESAGKIAQAMAEAVHPMNLEAVQAFEDWKSLQESSKRASAEPVAAPRL